MRLIVEEKDADALLEYMQKKVETVRGGQDTDCWIWKGIYSKVNTPIFVYRTSAGGTANLGLLNLIVSVIHKEEIVGRGIRTICEDRSCVRPEHVDYKPSLSLSVIDYIERSDPEGLVDYLDSVTEKVQDEKWEGSPCWTASNATNCNGYILIRGKGIQGLAHRVIAEFLSGGPVNTSQVHHKCSNRQCLNPEHYQITTQSANTAEMMARTFYEKRISQAESIMADLLKTLSEGPERDKVEAFLLAS
jgi:hypothetical protein